MNRYPALAILIATVLIGVGGCATPSEGGAAPATDAQTAEPMPSEPRAGATEAPDDRHGIAPQSDAAAAAGDTPTGWIARGDRALAADDLERAETAYRKAVESHPESADAWHGLGVALRKLERYDESLA